MPRPETGPMRFGDDWTGVFIRGDNAFGYAISLERLLSGKATAIDRTMLRGLLAILHSSDERNPDLKAQRAKLEEE